MLLSYCWVYFNYWVYKPICLCVFLQWAPIIFLIFVSSSITPNGIQSESKWGWTHRDTEGGGVAGASATHWIPPAAGLNIPVRVRVRPLVVNISTDIGQVSLPGFQMAKTVVQLILADYNSIMLKLRSYILCDVCHCCVLKPFWMFLLWCKTKMCTSNSLVYMILSETFEFGFAGLDFNSKDSGIICPCSLGEWPAAVWWPASWLGGSTSRER